MFRWILLLSCSGWPLFLNLAYNKAVGSKLYWKVLKCLLINTASNSGKFSCSSVPLLGAQIPKQIFFLKKWPRTTFGGRVNTPLQSLTILLHIQGSTNLNLGAGDDKPDKMQFFARFRHSFQSHELILMDVKISSFRSLPTYISLVTFL